MVFLGIHTNPDKTFTVANMDENRNIRFISNFWKEGLLWFLDHANADIIAVNISPWFDSIQVKNAYEVVSALKEIFGFEEPGVKPTEKVVLKTDADMFFSQLVRKELLPITTREGIEQRIYNLPKAGIMVKPELFSKEKKRLQKEVISIATAFAAYSIHHGTYSVEEKDGEQFYIPRYQFVPRDQRIISR
ncbi:hypothetical protein [Persephonella sp.]